MAFWNILEKRSAPATGQASAAPNAPVAPPPAARHAGSDPESENAWPLMDVHLLMNGFNQMAANLYAITAKDDPRLFAIADYLQHGLRSAGANISYAAETRLLQSYVELLLQVKGGAGITLVVEKHDTPETAEVPRHVTCDLLALFLKTLPGALIKQPVHVVLRPGALLRGVVLKAECASADSQRTLQLLDAAFHPYAARMAALGWQLAGTLAPGHAGTVAWTVTVQKGGV